MRGHSAPTASIWYNLHVAFATEARWMEIREDVLAKRLATIEAAAAKDGHRLSRAAVLADYVHLTLGCGPASRRSRWLSAT